MRLDGPLQRGFLRRQAVHDRAHRLLDAGQGRNLGGLHRLLHRRGGNRVDRTGLGRLRPILCHPGKGFLDGGNLFQLGNFLQKRCFQDLFLAFRSLQLVGQHLQPALGFLFLSIGSDLLQEAGADQPVQDLAGVQGAHAGLLHYLAHRLLAVHVGEDHPLLRGEAYLGGFPPLHGGHLEDHVEVGDLLLDAVPLVQAPGALHDELLGADGEPYVLLGEDNAGLELELAVRPAEHLEDGVLNLLLHEDFQLLLGDVTQPYQELAQALPLGGGLLQLQGLLQLGAGDYPRTQELHAQGLPLPVGGGEEDLPVSEAYISPGLPPYQVQGAVLLSEVQELKQVGKTEIL